MKQIEKLSENAHFTAINLGNLDDIVSYSLIHPVNKNLLEGKVFLKEATNATGTEISFIGIGV